MQEFIAIDFETANPKRVSACALGIAIVSNGSIVESKGYLIKPVGGHASFQSKIHGIKEEHTFDKPDFGELFPEIKYIFSYPLVAHSLFDKQVLNALTDHFGLDLMFQYNDSSAIAKSKLPHLKDCKLKTLVKHFNLPSFKHHDATEDAVACAQVFLKLKDNTGTTGDAAGDGDKEFRNLIISILADNEVSYKEVYQLLYWLDDHPDVAAKYKAVHQKTKAVLEDDHLDALESVEMRSLLKQVSGEGCS